MMSGPVLLALRILFTAALYAFLGWALYILWMDFKRQSRQLAGKQPPLLTIFYQVELETKSYRFNLPEVTLGRDPACDCILNDSTVSATHARLTYRQNQWWVEDLRSTNGTFLNQDPVFTPLVITNGDQLRCGQVLLTIGIQQAIDGQDEPSASPAPTP
jgi:pSer/pThr/pTyr-binding forkhead associated (FHA) protein